MLSRIAFAIGAVFFYCLFDKLAPSSGLHVQNPAQELIITLAAGATAIAGLFCIFGIFTGWKR